MGGGGQGLFFLYTCIENFKILHVRNHLSDFIITWQECCFGDPLPRLFKQSWFIKKHSWKGWGLFSLYIEMENFKNLLVRNHWTDFNITWQECSYGDSLPSLFKQSWFVKKHGIRGWGLFSLYSYMKHFKNLFVRNHWTDFNMTELFLWWSSFKIQFKPSWCMKKKHGRWGAGL